MSNSWMDETITEAARERHKRDMDALKAKYPELWEEAQKMFAKKTHLV